MNYQKIAFATSILLGLVFSTAATTADARQLSGLYDSHGKMLIPVEYDEIRREGDKFYAYKSKLDEDGKISWTKTEIDSTGQRKGPFPSDAPPTIKPRQKTRIEPPHGWRHSSSYDFGCSVSNDKGENGFLDLKGKLTIFEPDKSGLSRFEPIGPGLFLKHIYPAAGEPVVQLFDSDLRLISELPRDLNFIGEYYKDGLLKVSTKSHIIAFLNEKGQYQIKPTRITQAGEFRNGFCNVELEGHGKGACAVIDKSGNIVAGPYEHAEFVYGLNGGDQAIINFERKRYGVITLTGRVVIPFDADSIIQYGDKYVVHKQGICSIYSLVGTELIKFPANIVDAVPTENYIVFVEKTPTKRQVTTAIASRADQRTGVMDRDGNVIIPAQFAWSSKEIRNGLLVIYDSKNSITSTGVLNVKTKKMVLEPTLAGVTTQDGFIFVSRQDHVFDSTQFRQHRGRPAWGDFLRSYDLIGMPKSKVESLLGKPDQATPHAQYRLECGTCLNTYLGVEIEFDDKNIANGWRYVGRSTTNGWHRDNVVLIDNPEGQPLLVVPKSEKKA